MREGRMERGGGKVRGGLREERGEGGKGCRRADSPCRLGSISIVRVGGRVVGGWWKEEGTLRTSRTK